MTSDTPRTYTLADFLNYEDQRQGPIYFGNVDKAYQDTVHQAISELAHDELDKLAIGQETLIVDASYMNRLRDTLQAQFGPFTLEQLVFVTNAITQYFASMIGFHTGYDKGQMASISMQVVETMDKLSGRIRGNPLPSSSFKPPRGDA